LASYEISFMLLLLLSEKNCFATRFLAAEGLDYLWQNKRPWIFFTS